MTSSLTKQAQRNSARRARMHYCVDIDVVDPLHERGPSTALRDELEANKLCWQLVARSGPAGCPVLRISGLKRDIARWLELGYGDDGSNAARIRYVEDNRC